MFTDRLSSFERCWSSLLRFLMALRRSLLRIDKASLLETFGSLKLRNFGYTPSCLQLLKKSISNFNLFFLYSSFSYFRKSLIVTFTYLRTFQTLKDFRKENFNIKLVFNSFKIKNSFAYKDPIPNDLKSFLVYKFTCASCSSSYIGETCRHFKTRIEEHIKKDNKSHIFKHLHSSETCFDSYNSLCFKIIDKTNSKFDLKIKEALLTGENLT